MVNRHFLPPITSPKSCKSLNKIYSNLVHERSCPVLGPCTTTQRLFESRKLQTLRRLILENLLVTIVDLQGRVKVGWTTDNNTYWFKHISQLAIQIGKFINDKNSKNILGQTCRQIMSGECLTNSKSILNLLLGHSRASFGHLTNLSHFVPNAMKRTLKI